MSVSIGGRTGWTSIPNGIGRSRLPHTVVHLIVNLLSHAEGFNASYTLISEQTGMSSATIAKGLKVLQKLGLVTVKKERGEKGRFDSNGYDFHPEILWRITPELVEERLGEKKPASKTKADKSDDDRFRNQSGTASKTKAAPLQKLKTKKEQRERSLENDQPIVSASAPTAPSVPESQKSDQSLFPTPSDTPMSEWRDEELYPLFEELWKAHPLAANKPESFKQYKKALKLVNHSRLMQAAKDYKRFTDENGIMRGAISRSHNWLREQRWEDDYPTEPRSDRASQSRRSPESMFMDHLATRGAPSTQNASQPTLGAPQGGTMAPQSQQALPSPAPQPKKYDGIEAPF